MLAARTMHTRKADKDGIMPFFALNDVFLKRDFRKKKNMELLSYFTDLLLSEHVCINDAVQ